MGIAKNQAQEKREKRGKRGSTNNSKRLDAFRSRVGTSTADWGGCDARKLQGVILGITAIGGAATFGLSRDGGGHMLTIMLDGERETLWFNGNADLNEELDDVMGHIEAMT